MTIFSHNEINRIVQVVVQRLQQKQLVSEQVASRTSPVGHSPTGLAAGRMSTAVTDCRLITTATLNECVNRAARLQVPLGAVITPAARDWLSERNIQLIFGERSPKSTHACHVGWVYLAKWRTNRNLTDLHSVLSREFTRFDWCGDGDAMLTIPQAVQAVDGDPEPRAVLFTGQTCVALCRLNKHGHVRASLGTDLEAVREAIELLDNNVLVLDPTRHGTYALRNLVSTYAKTARTRTFVGM